MEKQIPSRPIRSAAIFAERLEGSYSGVMGLPLFETAVLLRDFGVTVLA